eukprot:scaffold14926_cov60-Phaeocystis_antarctica.AAC.2
MQTNAIPTPVPGDRAPTSEEPALIKMIQHTKLDQATPVCTMATAHYPHSRVHCSRKNCAFSP